MSNVTEFGLRDEDRMTMRQGQGYSRRRGDFLDDLNEAIRANPLPAALIGMGVLWMFAGGNKTSVSDAVTSRAPRRAAKSIIRGAEKAGESVMHGASEVGSTVTGAAYSAADGVKRAASTVGQAMTPSSFRGRSGDGSHDGGDPDLGSMYGHSDDQASTRSMASGVQNGISELMNDRPLLLGALGLALGAGIAASMPVSAAERKMMGKASGMVQDKVSDVAGQVKEMASAAIDETQSHVSGNGASPDASAQGASKF